MKKNSFMSLLLAVTMTLTLGAGLTFAAHPDIPLYTFEEIGMQFTPNFNPDTAPVAQPGDGTNGTYRMMPVMINDTTGAGFPYSPKQTCGNCHNGTTLRWDSGTAIMLDGQAITTGLVSYDEMNDETFHVEQGVQEWQHYGTPDTANATAYGTPGTGNETGDRETSQGGKPWSSSNGMWGKW